MIDNKYKNLQDLLSQKERELVSLIVADKSYSEMAEIMCIAASTMRKHASNIYKKANVSSREEFILEYGEINEILRLEGYSDKLERKLNKSINLAWKNNSEFEEYYTNFYEVMRSMYKLDFSKRLYESDRKDSFVNVIAKSINTLNDELASQFISENTVLSLLKMMGVNDKIILFSNDKETITHVFSTVKTISDLQGELVGLDLKSILSGERINELNINNSITFCAKLPFQVLPFEIRYEVEYNINKFPDSIIIVISLDLNRQFNEHAERIVAFIDCIKSQYDDNPALSNSVMGSMIAIEANEIYRDLADFIKIKRNQSQLK